MTANTPTPRVDALRQPGWGSVLVGTAAVFGLIVSGGVLAVAVAGLLQWGPKWPSVLDNGLPLLVLALGMVLSGRVAADVAGRRAPLCAVGAAVVVALLGALVSRSSEAHGDAIERNQVILATAIVLVVVGATTLVVNRRRFAR